MLEPHFSKYNTVTPAQAGVHAAKIKAAENPQAQIPPCGGMTY